MEALGLEDEEYITARFAGGDIDPMRTAAMENHKATGYLGEPNPTKIFMKFEAHENESHAVRWSPVERMVATGGADRKVKLWDIGRGKNEYSSSIYGFFIISILQVETNHVLC